MSLNNQLLISEERDNPLLQYALLYANQGWSVFPLHNLIGESCSCGKHDCKSPCKHPRTRNGIKDATIDAKKIKRFWQKWPDANIGIVTGKRSGLVVLDVDPAHGGLNSLNNFTEEYGEIFTLSQCTGGEGRHYVFNYPEGNESIKNSAGTLGKGLDVRADGGYIVAPPSKHISGGNYYWECDTEKKKLKNIPIWLLDLISPKLKKKSGNVTGLIVEGCRNNELMKIGGKLRQKGETPQKIKITLLEENRLKCQPPLDDGEVIKIANSLGSYSIKPKAILFSWRELILSDNGPKNTPAFKPSGSTTRHVLITLSTHMNMDGRSCFPTIEQLSQETNLSICTVKNCLKKAVEEGWVERYLHQGAGQSWRNYGYIAKLSI